MGRDGKGNVGFIGIGTMGREMARNLLKAGHAVRVFDRNEAAVADLEKEGAVRAQNPADAAREADIVITMLPDTPHVEGRQGVFAAAGSSRVLIALMKREAAPTSDVITRLGRVIQYAAAVRLKFTCAGILGRPVKPGDDSCGGAQRRTMRPHPAGLMRRGSAAPI